MSGSIERIEEEGQLKNMTVVLAALELNVSSEPSRHVFLLTGACGITLLFLL